MEISKIRWQSKLLEGGCCCTWYTWTVQVKVIYLKWLRQTIHFRGYTYNLIQLFEKYEKTAARTIHNVPYVLVNHGHNFVQ